MLHYTTVYYAIIESKLAVYKKITGTTHKKERIKNMKKYLLNLTITAYGKMVSKASGRLGTQAVFKANLNHVC